MDANENLGKKRKIAIVIVEVGVALMSSSILLFLITCFYDYAIVSQQPALSAAMFASIRSTIVEMLIFVLGFILLLIGPLIGLLGRLKKQ